VVKDFLENLEIIEDPSKMNMFISLSAIADSSGVHLTKAIGRNIIKLIEAERTALEAERDSIKL